MQGIDNLSELADYVSALPERYLFGYSLFDLFDLYSALPHANVKIFFTGVDIEGLTEAKVSRWNDLVSELQVIGKQCGDLANHPLKLLQTLKYSQQVKTDAATPLEACLRQGSGILPGSFSTYRICPQGSLPLPLHEQRQPNLPADRGFTHGKKAGAKNG